MENLDHNFFASSSSSPSTSSSSSLLYHDYCDPSPYLVQPFSEFDGAQPCLDLEMLKTNHASYLQLHSFAEKTNKVEISGEALSESDVFRNEQAPIDENGVRTEKLPCTGRRNALSTKQYLKQPEANCVSRQERRREQNRRAAHRCRLKKKMREAAVIQELEKELMRAQWLEAEVQRLVSQKRELEETLLQHSVLGPRDVVPFPAVSGFLPLPTDGSGCEHFFC